jgi:glycerophosphoryl diester phosphodiesterase
MIDSTIISSFLHDELLEVQKIEPKIRLASLEPTSAVKKFDWESKKEMIQYCIDNHIFAINPLVLMVDQQFVDYAHENNIKVFPWTIDSKISIKKLIRFGVDGIITNDIEIVKTLMNEIIF